MLLRILSAIGAFVLRRFEELGTIIMLYGETIRALRGYHPYRLGCCHCTGFRPLMRLNAEFPEACVQVAAGARHEFGD